MDTWINTKTHKHTHTHTYTLPSLKTQLLITAKEMQRMYTSAINMKQSVSGKRWRALTAPKNNEKKQRDTTGQNRSEAGTRSRLRC